MSIKIMTAEDAVKLIGSGKTLCSEGFVGTATAEELMIELQNRYRQTGEPRDLTLFYSAGQGDGDKRGLNHLGERGLLSRIIGGHLNLTPRLQKLIVEDKVEAYNLPQGVICQMYRDIAAGRPTISRVGLHTFVDPRMEGGKLNTVTWKDMVHLIKIDDEEYLKYDHINLDYAFIRGTYADEHGNVSMERESCNLGVLAVAEAVKNCGGTVFVQVEKVVRSETLDPRLIRIPGILVDVIVPVSDKRNHMQTFGIQYHPALSGESSKRPAEYKASMEMNVSKLIGRRCVLELMKGAVVNLGIGVPAEIAEIAREEGVEKDVTFTIEGGPIGGGVLSGLNFGAVMNPECIIDQAAMFDFYDGGGLDEAYLGLAECDGQGNINVSRFGTRIAGAGGFVNISQNAKKVVFCGSFTAKGLEVGVKDGNLVIIKEGKVNKFVKSVQQVTFNSGWARRQGREVLYVTERAVFAMTPKGIMITEIAPGMDLEKDVLAHIEFECAGSKELKLMDKCIFYKKKMGIDKK